jgi:hypothetical protein
MSVPALTVRLGYEVGTGARVDIPIRHMVVCGQTQESGKTTTLEALLDRAKMQALTFVTKPGESAFSRGQIIRPYFHKELDELTRMGFLTKAGKWYTTVEAMKRNIQEA